MTATCPRRRRRPHSAIAFLLAASALAGSLLLCSSPNRLSAADWLFGSANAHDNVEAETSGHRRLTRARLGERKFVDPKFAQLSDPKTVSPRHDADDSSLIENRKNCQVVYIMGVEGATHHGFLPVLESLAKAQVDPVTGAKYVVDVNPGALKAGLFGWYRARWRTWGFTSIPTIKDPDLVRSVVESSCPNDGRKHVMVEWQSFPSGHEDDPRSYRVHRQHEWLSMTPHEIASSDEALRHPANMTAFVEAYSPYAEIRFVVLSRPFLATIASHPKWDEGPTVHSNIIRGFLLVLRGFLDRHRHDAVDGARLWTLVCVERVMAKYYKKGRDATAARARITSYLANFLGWPVAECPHCFDTWRDSSKDPEKVLGKLGPGTVDTLVEHTKLLEGVWPPPGEEGVAEQQCGI